MVFPNLFKTKVEAKGLAATLFQEWVIGSLKTKYYENYIKRWRNSAEFNEAKCEYILYVYQVSVVVAALMAAAQKKPEFDKVGHSFAEHALSVARQNLNVSPSTFNQDVSEAVRSLTRLIFSDPSKNPALSFEWTRKWIGGFGANEDNPFILWEVLFNWKNSFLHLSRMFDEFKVM